MKYFEDFPWVRTFAGMRYHIIWSLKSLMAGCSVVRAHCCEAQLEMELLCRAVDNPYTVALMMPLATPSSYLGTMMKQRC